METKLASIIEQFWEIQNARDYTKLITLFDDNAVIEDPLWGTRVEGIAAIADFMTAMNEQTTEATMHFDPIEISVSGETAWCRWEAVIPGTKLEGCGVYKIKDDKITYYRDYYDVSAFKEVLGRA